MSPNAAKKNTQKASKSHKKEKKGVKKSGWIWSGGRSCLNLSNSNTQYLLSIQSRTGRPLCLSTVNQRTLNLATFFSTPDSWLLTIETRSATQSAQTNQAQNIVSVANSLRRGCVSYSAHCEKRLTIHACVTVKVKDAFGSLRVAFGSSGTFGPSWNFTLVQGGDASQTGLSEFPFHGSIPGGEKGLRAFSSSRTENKNTVARLAKCKS